MKRTADKIKRVYLLSLLRHFERYRDESKKLSETGTSMFKSKDYYEGKYHANRNAALKLREILFQNHNPQ